MDQIRTVDKIVLSDKIKEKILEDIVSKKYKPGERIVESKLAKELGVSQAPVREALKQLASMKIVSIEPYKGTTVMEYTKKDMRDFVVVRAKIEGFAISLAIDRITDEEIMKLQELVIKMKEAAERKDYDERAFINSQFHEAIIRASGNKLLIDMAIQLRLNSWSSTIGKHSMMNPIEIAERHQKIVDIIVARDADKGEKIMHDHIMDSFNKFNPDI